MRLRVLIGFLVLAFVATSLAGVLALSQTSSSQRVPPAPAPGSKAEHERPSKPEASLSPRIVRWVCTDRICGGCDGACSRQGHVATHKHGHCACTPREGGALDGAIRKAFEGHEKGR
ncbi:MAG TPA: hypothetical protein VGR38_13015 [Candidatus Polarisedimenticolia bacterium]|nr:hypothetical protein [Candidatus Polarisedimenticolia bacterium]